MRRALRLALRGWGRVSPNPLVGAVVVRDGRVVGEGYHAEFGGPHAEAVALGRAGDAARGATLYVTLEPCAHRGKTPPCTHAILDAGVRRVVYATADPHPAAAGGGAWLRARGVEVTAGVCEAAAREWNAPFLVAAAERRTFVALKLALSLDARIAEAPARRTPLTGPRALRAAHRLRAGHDAVAVGIGTVLADDPLLTVRVGRPPRRPPVRVVLDAELGIPSCARLLETADAAPVWIFAGPRADGGRRRALEARGARVLEVPESVPGRLDLRAVLGRLWEEGITSVLFEGGARVAADLLARGLVDRLHLAYAPRLLGPRGVSPFGPETGPAAGPGPAGRWRLVARRALGPDTWLTLAPD